MSISVDIGAFHFPSKASAQFAVKSIIEQYQDGEAITGAHFEFLLSLVGLHKSASKKIGSGVTKFFVKSNPLHRNNRCLYIERTDGSCTDFSYLKCVGARNPIQDRYTALRNAVADQITSFRLREFSRGVVRCSVSGRELDVSDCHIDHKFPLTFRVLVENWLVSASINIDAVKIDDSTDNRIGRIMTDARQRESWSDFHRNRAVLRPLDRIENLRLGSRNGA